ncbi:glucose-1-phosphate adenylyltransferase [Miniphocaeibacter halophilus]|uniref:Glucose-1-phosphate adenylyltransferase n=1 Tax=Miniphocaeibacter halophilus TaxID=2931922 RepID=A0AC61MNK4_9FIRM|nr:glucose-1-phosphate adenylyltransferase [Miniphocaeibacter halophilus]QQK07101.1 glucose-1-phosphate adenylyltransferase [Miniphocaeibacter halophilus]
MRARKRVVAMLLAGGQGSRLKGLTKKIAKPAVPFGGKYRIIDFALSNATNSDIRDIGVLTQYKPFLLNTHLGNGAAWDYDRNSGGLRVLPPFATEEGGRWYEGTANAIYENIDFLDDLAPEYVLILSGDHIYKMNYNELLDYHKEKNSACTIAVMEVPWEEASRFGILNTDKDNKIVEFDEKPENPKNNLASMGIYMFNWSTLREFLIKDAEDKDSDHDFGKNVLPAILNEGYDMYAWKFDGYWKDVGTVKSYWEANLDLLNDNNLNLYDKKERIFTKAKNLPPHFIANGAVVKKALINEACRVYGTVKNSVLFSSVIIEEGAEVVNSVILSNVVIKKGAKVYNAVINEDCIIDEKQEIGSPDDKNVYLVDDEGICVD